MKTLGLGSRLRFTETFKDLVAGTVADPTGVTLKIHDPTGTETSYTYAAAQIVRDSQGIYHFDLTLSIPGLWLARWVGDGAIVATDELQVTIAPSGFTSP